MLFDILTDLRGVLDNIVFHKRALAELDNWAFRTLWLSLLHETIDNIVIALLEVVWISLVLWELLRKAVGVLHLGPE